MSTRTQVETFARRWLHPDAITRGTSRPTGLFVAEVWSGTTLIAVAERDSAKGAWRAVMNQLQEKRDGT